MDTKISTTYIKIRYKLFAINICNVLSNHYERVSEIFIGRITLPLLMCFAFIVNHGSHRHHFCFNIMICLYDTKNHNDRNHKNNYSTCSSVIWKLPKVIVYVLSQYADLINLFWYHIGSILPSLPTRQNINRFFITSSSLIILKYGVMLTISNNGMF